MTERFVHFLCLKSIYTHFGHARTCATPYFISLINFIIGLEPIVEIPMGTNCTPLVADLFLYCYERDWMDSLNHEIKLVLSRLSTSRYLDDIFNTGIPYFEGMLHQRIRLNYS